MEHIYPQKNIKGLKDIATLDLFYNASEVEKFRIETKVGIIFMGLITPS